MLFFFAIFCVLLRPVHSRLRLCRAASCPRDTAAVPPPAVPPASPGFPGPFICHLSFIIYPLFIQHVLGNQIGPFLRHRRHRHGLRRRRHARQGLRRHRLGLQCLSPHVRLPGRQTNRGHAGLRRIQSFPQARPGGGGQRPLPRQRRGRSRPRPQIALLFPARTAQGILHPRQTLHSGRPALTAKPPPRPSSPGFSSTTA